MLRVVEHDAAPPSSAGARLLASVRGLSRLYGDLRTSAGVRFTHVPRASDCRETRDCQIHVYIIYRCIYIFDRLQLILPFVCIIIVPLGPSTLGVQLKLLKGKAPQGAAYFTCLWTSKIISIVLRKNTDIYPKSAISFKAIKYKIISDCTTKKWLQILLILLHDVTLSRYRCNKDLSV